MQYRTLLIPLYAVATLFPRLLALPFLPPQVQLTELIFPLALWCFRRDIVAQVRRFPLFTAAAALYLLANFLSALWAGNAGAMLEAGARAYLVVVSYLVLAHLSHYGSRQLLAWWKWATVIVAGLSTVVYTLIAVGGMTDPFHLVSYVADYPYLGNLYRLQATAPAYGMYYMLLLPGMWWAYRDWREGGGALWPLLLIILAALLTFGKENLLFPAGVLLYEAGRGHRWSLPLTLAGLTTIIFLLLGTHYLAERPGHRPREAGYTAGPPVATIGGYRISETNYTANKRAALLIGARHPGLGVGPGRFSSHTEALVATGDYPAHFGRFDPHSAWTGAFAETGLLGLLGLLALVGSLLYYRPGQLTAVAVVLLLFLVASVFKDIMNFRGLWVVIGLYLCPRGSTQSER